MAALLFAEQLQLLQQIAMQAGEAVMAIYRQRHLDVQWKSDNSPLTQADLASHQLITQALQQHFSWPVMSEEAADIPWLQRQLWQTYWLLDPLDGTKEFIKGNGEFTVNIALIHQGEPVAGVVYAPAIASCYWGAKGLGSWKVADNQVSCLTAQATPAAEVPRVLASRSHTTPGLTEFLAKLGAHQLMNIGSSLKLCLLAEGLAEFYPRLGLTHEWDTAAGQAVLVNAGGDVRQYQDNQPLRYNQKPELTNPWFIATSRDGLVQAASICGATV